MNNLTKTGRTTIFTAPRETYFFTDSANFSKQGEVYFINHCGNRIRFSHKDTQIAGVTYTEANFETQIITQKLFSNVTD